MKTSKINILAASILALALTACSGQKSTIEGGRLGESFLRHFQQSNAIEVLSLDQQPLANAKILIGNAIGQPFDGNYLTTNEAGQVALPAAWTSSQPVTIDAPGYVRATYFAQDPGAHSYRLRHRPTGTQYEVQGITQGHNVVDFDGLIDFGLVVSAITRNALLNFNVDSVISPENDTISIVGNDVDVPSNVTLPLQKESYFLPITIEKPTYRIYFDKPGQQKIFAARGRFPFKEVVGDLRNKTPFYKLINKFTVMGGTVKDIEVSKSNMQLNIDVNGMTFDGKTSVSAPRVRGDESMLAVALYESSGYLIPTDVKLMTAGDQMQLSTNPRQSPLLLAVLKRNEDLDNTSAPGADRMSAALVPANGRAAPHFLPMMGQPTIASNGDVLIPQVSPVEGINAVATYSVLSQVQDAHHGSAKVKVNNEYWEMFAPQWATVLSLPKWPDEHHQAQGKKHLEVNLVGSLNASQVDLGPAMIKDATHVTHSSLDF